MKEIDRQISYRGYVLEISFRYGNYIGTCEKIDFKFTRYVNLGNLITHFIRCVDNYLDGELKIYKGIELMIIRENTGWNEQFVGNIQKSSNKVTSFCARDKEQVVKDFERYVDKLEKITKIYTQLTGKRIV